MTISGGPIPSIKFLLRALRSHSTFPEDLWYNACPGYATRFHLLGRCAMEAGIRAIERIHDRANATVWLPDYICREVTEHLQAKGIRLRFYPVSKDLSPDWVSLESLVEPESNLKIFVLVHYFGFCNDVRTAGSFCDRHGMLFMEDAAHVLAPHVGLGRGDLTIYSPRKLFAIPSGGVLVIKDEFESYLESEFTHSSNRGIVRWAMLSLLKDILLQLHVPWHLLRTNGSLKISIDKPDQFEGLNPNSYNPYALDLLSAARSELPTIVEKRRTNYFTILPEIKSMPEAYPFYSTMDEYTCPYAFPVYVQENIEKIIARLNKSGIPASRWPLLPFEILTEPHKHQVAINIYDHLMLLPVHQSINKDQAHMMGKALREALV